MPAHRYVPATLRNLPCIVLQGHASAAKAAKMERAFNMVVDPQSKHSKRAIKEAHEVCAPPTLCVRVRARARVCI